MLFAKTNKYEKSAKEERKREWGECIQIQKVKVGEERNQGFKNQNQNESRLTTFNIQPNMFFKFVFLLKV